MEKNFKIGDVVKLTKSAREVLYYTVKGATATVVAVEQRGDASDLVTLSEKLLTTCGNTCKIGAGWLKLAHKKAQKAPALPVTIWYITPDNTIDFVIKHTEEARDTFIANTKYASTDITDVATILRSSIYWFD